MLFTDLEARLKEIDLPNGKFAVFGSGPIAVRGLKEPHDFDVIVSQEIYDFYKKQPNWIEKPCKDSFYLDNNGIELWYHWGPGEWDISELIRNAEILDGLPYVRLEEVLKWKMLNARPKDLEDVERIRQYLKS